MQAMSQMNTSDFPKSQRKLIKKISSLAPYDVIQEILGFYACPSECGALCCKFGDIPLILDDKKRISSKGIGYRKIVSEGTEFKQAIINGEEVTEEVFKEHPCPFLHSDRCSIHKFSPKICSLYPFKTTSKSASLLEIVACKVGEKIIIDFTAFELFMVMLNKSTQAEVPQRLTEAVLMVDSIKKAGTEDLTKAMVFGLNDFEKLRFFLLYLNNEAKPAIEARREELKNIADNKLNGI